MYQIDQDMSEFRVSENDRVLEMTDEGDGPVVNKDNTLAGNRKTLSK